MNVYRISAVTLRVKDMKKSCIFYSRLPGFHVIYGGKETDRFTTFEIGEGSKTYLNLELASVDDSSSDYNLSSGIKWKKEEREDFGRVVFHTEDVDGLYSFMKNDGVISKIITFENAPSDAPWGERFFHINEPDGYQLSFAQPLQFSQGKQRN
jgi:catechol 2,3-dioxygenase-like lactoylglutathione lyase family enzyme